MIVAFSIRLGEMMVFMSSTFFPSSHCGNFKRFMFHDLCICCFKTNFSISDFKLFIFYDLLIICVVYFLDIYCVM